MISCAHFQFSALQFENLLPKITQKGWVSITHNREMNAMQSNHFSSENFCNGTCRIWVLNQNKVYILVEPINYHQKRVIHLGLRKPHYKIHAYLFPNSIRDW
ncbi:unnamed protein product [Lupinus luteus]|uniref:Uncharacterized protein n=1 Tax=Lupinus luteus TaxID=3873 RepID=A0AAV1YHP5_LUPLU